jgi:drug/metabolite transporter (DMT)-like permease
MSVSCLLLLGYILVRRVNPMKMHEFIPGVINGLLMAIGAYATFKAMSFYGAEIVFPFTVAVPILLVLILGHFVYHERIGRVGWLASLCGVGGLVALSLGQK